MREYVRDRERLEHIIESIDRILSFAAGKTKEELEADNLKYYGVVKNIEIIGEAAYKLTNAFCRQHAETPWKHITRMRHVLVHDYYQINPVEVWKVIGEDLHPLRDQVSRYLTETDWEAWEKNEAVIVEATTSKNLEQTARRMKAKGYSVSDIVEITGLSEEDIESL
ncbi:MAG: DUF86 domain-containing protein [Bacteroidales bacterium]|nr:DUF86 domain-containing protein [Bacteroidales bacterium]